MNISVNSMSKVYESESFYKPFINSQNFIDCTDIEGINCYATDFAVKELRRRMNDLDLSGVHFIDSGNYHYLTYFFLERISEPFELVLIDKHPDCKIPMFEEFLSCGGWIRNAFLDINNLKKVYMIGTDEDLLYELDDLMDYKENVTVVTKESYLGDNLSKDNLPIYISLDKDVLSEEVVTTNWNQGQMTLEELDDTFLIIKNNRRIIGIDICGEADISEASSIHNQNDLVNAHLMSHCESCTNNRPQ